MFTMATATSKFIAALYWKGLWDQSSLNELKGVARSCIRWQRNIPAWLSKIVSSRAGSIKQGSRENVPWTACAMQHMSVFDEKFFRNLADSTTGESDSKRRPQPSGMQSFFDLISASRLTASVPLARTDSIDRREEISLGLLVND
jgi:hypothetical protein